MDYVAIYKHILVVKDDCDPQWMLDIICGTKDGHGRRNESGEFIPFSTYDIPTVIKRADKSRDWEEMIIPYSTLVEALEDIHKKDAYYDLNDIGYLYSGDYFGLTAEEQEKIIDFLYESPAAESVIETSTEWLDIPDDIENELPFL